MANLPKWKKFEQLVANIQKNLSPNAKVTHNDKIRGKKSQTERQIDVSIRDNIGQYKMLIAMECKDYSKPVDISDVEQFIQKLKDIRANRGAIVSAKGFTKSAIELGKTSEIKLYRVVDLGEHEWKTFAAKIPVIVKIIGMDGYRFRINCDNSLIPLLPKLDIQNIQLYNEDKKPIGTPKELIYKKIDNNEIPNTPGVHLHFQFLNNPVNIKVNDKFFCINIDATIIVSEKNYFHNLPLVDIQGFHDQISGGVVTKSITTDIIKIGDVLDNWRLIEDMSELAIEPFMTMILHTSPITAK